MAVAFAPGTGAQNDTANLPAPMTSPVIPAIPERKPQTEAGADKKTKADAALHAPDEAEWEGEEGGDENNRDTAEDTPQIPNASPFKTDKADLPPLPKRKPIPAKSDVKHSGPAGPAPLPEEWSAEEITRANAQCENLLADALFEFEPLKPVRNGVCGTPAPIELAAVRASPTVSIRPAAKLNCQMASRFHRWMAEIVQPSAKTHLNSAIAGVINVASYHCRTRYNDPAQRMSQHAFFNALDLSGFITAGGKQITIAKGWEGETPESRFLKEIHEGACKIFGTVLGPEANAAHRDHFHLDMTKRRNGNYCR